MFSNLAQTNVTSQWPWHLTYDPQNLISSSLRTFVQSLKKIPQSVLEILCSQEIRTAGQTTRKHNASGPGYRQRGGIKTGIRSHAVDLSKSITARNTFQPSSQTSRSKHHQKRMTTSRREGRDLRQTYGADYVLPHHKMTAASRGLEEDNTWQTVRVLGVISVMSRKGFWRVIVSLSVVAPVDTILAVSVCLSVHSKVKMWSVGKAQTTWTVCAINCTTNIMFGGKIHQKSTIST